MDLSEIVVKPVLSAPFQRVRGNLRALGKLLLRSFAQIGIIPPEGTISIASSSQGCWKQKALLIFYSFHFI